MATALTPRQLAMQQAGFYDGSKGYGQGQESAAYRGLTPEQQAQVNSAAATPAMPALQEPLHQWEKTALTGLSNTGNTAGTAEMQGVMKVLQQMTGGNYDFLGQGNTATQSAIKPVTMDEITGIANPYAEGLKSNLSATAQKLRAQIDAGQGSRGGRSFGDTATGVRQSEVDLGQMAGEREIDYQSFTDALGQINTERNRSMTGGGQFGNLAGTQIGGANALAGVAGNVRTNSIDDILNQLKSGGYVRDYNQTINDVMRNDILAESEYPTQQLSGIMELLKNYQSGGSYYHPEKESTASKVGDYASAAASVAAMFSDIRLKEDVRKVGEKDGIDIIEFRYKGQPSRWRGVNAQQVREIAPHAVIERDGYLMVNYAAINIPFERVV